MTQIAQLTPNAMVGNEMLALWQEYEQGVTPEARAVKQLDKFDMIAQAFEYERDRGTHGLQEFFDSTANSAAINSEPFISWNKELLAQRTALQQQQKGSNDKK
jgi:putative hydrolase of HD superfamily